MFLLTGVAEFLGSLWLNHTPEPAEALVSPLREQELSVKTTMSSGGLVAEGTLLAGVGEYFLVLMNILMCSWISLDDVTEGLNILMLLGGLIA